MSYYSEGKGWVDKVDVEKTKQFIDRYSRHYNLDFVFSEEEAFLELKFSFSSWYVEDDFPEEGEISRGSGIFRDLREILTTEPTVLSFTGQDSLYYLVLITPKVDTRPYLVIEMVIYPSWKDVPEQYLGAVRRYFQGDEKLTEPAKRQKLIDREMEKIDVPQEGVEAQYADDPKFREFVDRRFNEVATDAPFEDMVVFAFGGWQEAIEEFHKLYSKEG